MDNIQVSFQEASNLVIQQISTMPTKAEKLLFLAKVKDFCNSSMKEVRFYMKGMK